MPQSGTITEPGNRRKWPGLALLGALMIASGASLSDTSDLPKVIQADIFYVCVLLVCVRLGWLLYH